LERFSKGITISVCVPGDWACATIVQKHSTANRKSDRRENLRVRFGKRHHYICRRSLASPLRRKGAATLIHVLAFTLHRRQSDTLSHSLSRKPPGLLALFDVRHKGAIMHPSCWRIVALERDQRLKQYLKSRTLLLKTVCATRTASQS